MNCKEGTIFITRQIKQLLQLISTQAYSKPLVVFNEATLGQHFRHIFDFYDCLLRGIPEGLVDYASRQRNEEMEKDPLFAEMAFQGLGNACRHLEENQLLKVRADFSSFLEAGRPVVESSVGRELMFAYDHAVHHLALIKIALKETLPDVSVGEELGVAPSTLKHRNGQAGVSRR